MTVVVASIVVVYYYAVSPFASQPSATPSNDLNTSCIEEVNGLIIEYKLYPIFDLLYANLALMQVWLHENGEEQFVVATSMGDEIVGCLEQTIRRINLRINCSLTEEETEDILRNDKVVELRIRHYADYNTIKFTLENIHNVLFVIEDKLNRGLEGYVIIGLFARDL